LLNLLILVHFDKNTANAMVVHIAPELCETQVRNEKTTFQPTSWQLNNVWSPKANFSSVRTMLSHFKLSKKKFYQPKEMKFKHKN